MSKAPEYRIEYGFSYAPKTGPYKGQTGVVVGPGEPIPDEVLKDSARMKALIRTQKISIRDAKGEFHVRKDVKVLTDGQIDMFLKEGNGTDLDKLLGDPDVSRDSLIRLYATAEARGLPDALVRRIEAASIR